MSEPKAFTANELLAGYLWVKNRFANVNVIDLLVLRIDHELPDYAEAYIKNKWIPMNACKKPFAASELYQRPQYSSSSSSSSEYTE